MTERPKKAGHAIAGALAEGRTRVALGCLEREVERVAMVIEKTGASHLDARRHLLAALDELTGRVIADIALNTTSGAPVLQSVLIDSGANVEAAAVRAVRAGGVDVATDTVHVPAPRTREGG